MVSESSKKSKLRQYLVDRFSLNDLMDLAFDLGIDFQSLPHETTQELARELIGYCEHREQTVCLVTEVLKRRPDYEMESLFSEFLGPTPKHEDSDSKKENGKTESGTQASNVAESLTCSICGKEFKPREVRPDMSQILRLGMVHQLDWVTRSATRNNGNKCRECKQTYCENCGSKKWKGYCGLHFPKCDICGSEALLSERRTYNQWARLLGKDGEVKVETEPAKCNKCKKLLCERHAWWAKKKTQHEEDFEGWEESNPIIVEKTDFDSVPFRKEYVTVSPGGHMYAKYRDTGIVHEYIEYLCLDHPPFFLAKFLWTSRRDKQS